jgi:hypothetical protein
MNEELVSGIAKMIKATLGDVPLDEWVPINRFGLPDQEVPTAPPGGPGLN